MFKLLYFNVNFKEPIKSKRHRYMLAQIDDGCSICRLVAQCVDPQIALRDLQIALRDRQIAQIRRLRLTSALNGVHACPQKFRMLQELQRILVEVSLTGHMLCQNKNVSISYVMFFKCYSVGRGNSSHTKMWGISSHRNLQKNRKR